MAGDFDGRVVLVTGASSGIGAVTAQAFADEGASVMVTGRNAGRTEATRAAIETAGGKARAQVGDIADGTFCNSVVAATMEAFGQLDVLVNNAGVCHCVSIPDTTDELWRETMSVNLDAVFFLSRAALRHMRERKSGAIVSVASDAGIVGVPALGSYCASKGAVVQMTRAMALDHAPDGIRVNAVCPSVTETPMLHSVYAQSGMSDEEGSKSAAAENPLNMIAEPRDVSDAILYLASERARFITGVAFMIDGGYTAG